MPEALRTPPAEPKVEPKTKAKPPKERKPREPKPKPVREPKPARAPGESSKAFPIAIAAGVILAIVLGFVIGGSGGGGSSDTASPPPKGGLTGTAEATNAAVKVPSGWSKLDTAPDVPGLSVAAPTAVAPGGKDGEDAIVFGNVDRAADNPALLAGTFLQGLDEPPSSPDAAVQIGDSGLQAYRYDGLKPNGFDREVTVYAVPTSAGVATLACLSKDVSAMATTCDQIANSMTLSDGKPVPVGPSKAYARPVSKAMSTLGKADKSGLSKLKSAKTPQAQAAATRSLSNAYDKAAKSVAKIDANPQDGSLQTQLVRALRQTGAAYDKAAKAAARKSKSGFAGANGDIGSGRKAVADALARMKAAGYDVAT
jgi:hypothetical protein